MDPIIAATDGSEDSLRAVEWAAREAVLRSAPLRVVSVLAMPPQVTSDPTRRQNVAALIQDSARQSLANAVRRATDVAPGLTVGTRVLSGRPGPALAEAGAGASMLVVGCRGTGGFAAMTLGSVSRYVATHARLPVVVARQETVAVHREIVVGVRDPGEVDAALEFAFAEAALRNARLLAIHAWYWFLPAIRPLEAVGERLRAVLDPHEVSAAASVCLDESLAGWRNKYPAVEAGWEVVHAHPGRVLAGASARADLVVLGGHPGGDGIRVGAITHAVLDHAHGPVACVPAPCPSPVVTKASARAAGRSHFG
jgi:nucleotide-binding universal stress UspA family protein